MKNKLHDLLKYYDLCLSSAKITGEAKGYDTKYWQYKVDDLKKQIEDSKK